ncbi:MAG: hypothetical protein O7F73_12450 [Gammaproteobacteria bacterium]|nr:hypothetical protein [Gammaproteobacteria bacterium]
MNNRQDWFNPRRLILVLLDTDPKVMTQSKMLVRAGEAFGFSTNQLRVALSRLVAEGLLDNPARGHYRLNRQGALLSQEIQRWRSLDQHRLDWQGDWIAVLTDSLASEGSTLWRHQLRALTLRGMARWRPGLWVRPANLSGGSQQLVEDLRHLGLDALQGSFTVQQADAACLRQLSGLWDCEALNRGYQLQLQQVYAAIKRLHRLSVRKALVDTLKVGSATVRLLLKDPLLPDEMVNGAKRQELTAAMMEYDDAGKQLWRQFYDSVS